MLQVRPGAYPRVELPKGAGASLGQASILLENVRQVGKALLQTLLLIGPFVIKSFITLSPRLNLTNVVSVVFRPENIIK
jgi:hypothetical protein